MRKLFVIGILVLGIAVNSHAQAKFVKNMMAGKPQVLVIYGTSISSMAPNGRLWVRKLGAELNTRYKNLLTVYNSGRSGQNSQWALQNLRDSVLNKKPNAVIIEFATNDAVSRFNISLEECRQNTGKLIDQILQNYPDCEIILHTPCGFPLGKNAENRPELDAYNKLYRTVADERGYLYIDESEIFKDLVRSGGESLLRQFAGDGVHPTQRGALEIMFPNVLKGLTNDQTIKTDISAR
jgi:lysophospholipase L1-like esterase